jgi:formate dehydrogenase
MFGSRAADFLVRTADRAGALFGARPWSFQPRLLLRIMLRMSRELSFKKLSRSRQGVLLREHRTGDFFSRRIMTGDNKFHLAPQEFIAEGPALKEIYQAEINEHGFKMIIQRQRRTHNSWFHNVESMSGKEKTNFISINPADANEIEIEDGERVEVKSATGTIVIPARITDEVPRRVVAVPHGWGHDGAAGLSIARQYPGLNVNKLTASGPMSLEKFAGMSRLNGLPVSIRKAE